MIELIVVLTVIGMLTVLSVPLAVQQFRSMSRLAAKNNASAQFDVLWALSFSYRRDYTRFPDTLDQVDFTPPAGSPWEPPVAQAVPGVEVERAMRWVLVGRKGSAIEGRTCTQTIWTEGRDERTCDF